MKVEKKKDEEPREFLDLDVSEVSMVDRPANLREFLVVKRLEDTMGAFDSDNPGADPSEIGMSRQTIQTAEVTVEKAAATVLGDLGDISEFLSREDVEKAAVPSELKQSITRVIQLLGKVASGKFPFSTEKAPEEKAAKTPEEEEEEKKKKAGVRKAAAEAVSELATVSELLGVEKIEKAVPADLKTAIMRVTQFLGKVAGGKYPSPTSKAKTPEEEEEAKKRKAKEDEEEAKKKAKEKEEEDGKHGVQKNAGDDPPAVQIFDDGRVVVAGQPINKARGFTANRTDTIKGVVKSLVTLLKEVDEPALKAVLSEMGTVATPAAKGAESAEGAESAAVQKNAEDAGEIVKLIKDLGTRLETIEKARSPSTSVDGDGGTETVVEKNQGFWSGVL